MHGTLKSVFWVIGGVSAALALVWLGAAAPYWTSPPSPNALLSYLSSAAGIIIGVGSVMSFPFKSRGAKALGLLVAAGVVISVIMIPLVTACSYGDCRQLPAGHS